MTTMTAKQIEELAGGQKEMSMVFNGAIYAVYLAAMKYGEVQESSVMSAFEQAAANKAGATAANEKRFSGWYADQKEKLRQKESGRERTRRENENDGASQPAAIAAEKG